MRVTNKWVVVGAAAAVAGFASATTAGDTTRNIKLNDPIAVEEVAGQLSAVDPGQPVHASADDSGQRFGAYESPGSPDSPGDSPDSTADSPDSTAYDHADSPDSVAPGSAATANPQQRGNDRHHEGAGSADSAYGDD